MTRLKAWAADSLSILTELTAENAPLLVFWALFAAVAVFLVFKLAGLARSKKKARPPAPAMRGKELGAERKIPGKRRPVSGNER